MPQRATYYLLLETSRHFTREIFRGAIRWSNLYGPVTFIVSTGHVDQELPRLRDIENVGVIARLPTPGVVDAVRELKVPVVTIEPSLEEYVRIKQELGISEIISDAAAIAGMAFDYFLERGFHNFAYCGLPCRIWSQLREEAFSQLVVDHGGLCHIYPQPDKRQVLSREKEQPYLVNWLKSLPKPVAILTCNDDRGSLLLETCQRLGYLVPDEIAVLGIDNDDLICELTTPPLSSIAFNLSDVGFQAADLLWNLISGAATGYHRIDVLPTEIVTRLSTDVLAQDNEVVNLATRFIRTCYQRPIGVAEVARDLNLSRRTLERHFSVVLGCSVREQIDQFRLNHAKSLLIETDDPVERIARLSGFGNLKPMLRAFSQYEGTTPGKYRRLNRHKTNG
ncbi:MAG: DNA-binding transcriptional regulator [Planctomycetia bacterium]|nr:DNA-binding transcriptional regulator [Planctomycetia bacterium]